MTCQELKTLIDFNYWAKKRLLDSLQQITDGQFIGEIGGSHGSIRGTLLHIMGAEAIWVKRIRGEHVAGFPAQEEFPTLDALASFWEDIEQEMKKLASSWTSDADVANVIAYKDLKGNPYTGVLWQILQHVVNHSTYHRGQVTVLMRQLGLKPAGTDLITFYRERSV